MDDGLKYRIYIIINTPSPRILRVSSSPVNSIDKEGKNPITGNKKLNELFMSASLQVPASGVFTKLSLWC